MTEPSFYTEVTPVGPFMYRFGGVGNIINIVVDYLVIDLTTDGTKITDGFPVVLG